jgi:hypothetical protein
VKRIHPRTRCFRIICECEQLIRDVEWWNRNRPNDPPMDCEPERVLLPVARQCLAAWDAGDSVKAGVLAAKMVEIGGGSR